MTIATLPYIPKTITVHLGAPSQWAENITVSFPDYIKNVASSEIYPTWEPSALRANVLAITSFALNRVFTEFYRSQGYDFEITSTTAYDQKFIPNRNIFENISQLVDSTFDSYIRRRGFIEPLSAKFCNGTTSTCDGLSQWGSQSLAQEGYNSMEILRYYYGDDIELVVNAPIRNVTHSYPGYPLRLGSVGEEVFWLQAGLNRIGRNYPAIPAIPTTGVYDEATREAVRAFQRIFALTPDGIVGKATWYRVLRIYVGVTNLSELASLGYQLYAPHFEFPGTLRLGDSGGSVQILQYMLALLSEYSNALLPIQADGLFGPSTQEAVRIFQGLYGLPTDGVVGPATWEAIHSSYQRLYIALQSNTAYQKNRQEGASL
ncbi:MAG: peptidoglycan-binding protein [Clostridiales bacterium]|nr:peptidoglycan-binding protein [Clostridiales bacterium]